MTKETKLGIFVIAGLIALIGTIMLLGNFSLQKRYNIYILFDDIAGLPDKAKVKIAGVEVGAVSKITLEGNKAKLKVWIKQDVQIHCDTRASVVATGIIGSKYLELTMGSPSAPLLKDGDVIVGVNPVSLDKVVAQIVEKIDTLFSSFQGPQGKDLFKNLAETMENIKVVTATLRKGLENQEAKITAIVNNFDSFSKNLSDITGENRDDIRVAIKQIRESRKKASAAPAVTPEAAAEPAATPAQ
jgi:phospholipid/cholesterol/gamma-HCH transport system substrate-binding protein